MGTPLARQMERDLERRRHRFLNPEQPEQNHDQTNLQRLADELKIILHHFAVGLQTTPQPVDQQEIVDLVDKLVKQKLGQLSLADLNRLIHKYVSIPIENIEAMIDYSKRLEISLK